MGVLLLNGRLRPKGEWHARGRLILVVKFIMAFPFVEGYTGYTKVESIKKQEYGFIDLDRAIHIPMVDNRCCYAHNILCLFLGYCTFSRSEKHFRRQSSRTHSSSIHRFHFIPGLNSIFFFGYSLSYITIPKNSEKYSFNQG